MKDFTLAALLLACFSTANAGLLDSKQSLVCDTAAGAKAVTISHYMEVNNREHDLSMPAGCHYEVATVEAIRLWDERSLTAWVRLSNSNQFVRAMSIMDVPENLIDVKRDKDILDRIRKLKTPEKK